MTPMNDKQIAMRDGISPNFQLIEIYLKDISEETFYRNYGHYRSKILDKLKIALSKHKLDIYLSDIFYFLVEAYCNNAKYTFARDASLPSQNNKALKQKKVLLDFLSQISNRKYKRAAVSEMIGNLEIKEIAFISNKTDVIKINASPLCFEIIDILNNYYYKNKSQLTEEENINSKQFNRKFVLSLTPLINYLDNETIKWSIKNELYKFVSDLLLIVDIDIDYLRIKDVLKSV